jgi:hypothetical protein
MMLKCLLVMAAMALSYKMASAVDCVDAPTYDGAATLAHGASACAELQPGESVADKGKQYVTCNNGLLLIQNCSATLRYDTASKVCNYPQAASCDLFPTDDQTTPAPGNDKTTQPWTPAVVVTAPTDECGPTTCLLPHCFCYGAPFTAVAPENTPQFIMLTFDDAITAALYQQFYNKLFIDNTFNLTNPNGCKINTAMYTINENTDYSKLQTLATAGNEIASHTINHILAQGDNPRDYGNISAEISGMRDMIHQHTGDQTLADSVVGFRAPYLRVAGNVMFQVLRDNKFLYDTSIVNIETSQGRPPLWPFTLDYRIKSCVNPPCPTESFPGLWEVPLNGWVGDDGFGCGMIDGCNVGESVFTATEQDWYNYYERNFQDHFYKNKVPMEMFTHASMFIRSPGSFLALVGWLQDTMAAHKDVWLVSPRQVIEWMQNPYGNTDLIANKWGCHGA